MSRAKGIKFTPTTFQIVFGYMMPSLNFLLIIFGILKVWSRNEQEWKMKEARLAMLEARTESLAILQSVVVEIRTKLGEMNQEMERMRNRLDKFLDIQK